MPTKKTSYKVEILIQSILTLFLMLVISTRAFAQDFGIYETNHIGNNSSDLYARQSVQKGYQYRGDWTEFILDTLIKDGYHKEFCYFYNSCSENVKMEGLVKDGRQEGMWKLFINENTLFIGNFKNGKKNGLWKGLFINDNDTTCFTKIEFKDNLYSGQKLDFTFGDKLYKITNYKDGIKHGSEKEYFTNNEQDIQQTKEIVTYYKGKLHGKYLILGSTPNDTLTDGTYAFGARNGKFTFIKSGGKIIANYKNGKLEGRFKKYYPNGTLAYELDYKNNLPYNVIQIKDSSGNVIETNTLKSGNGTLNYYDENGNMISSCDYKNQLISGQILSYFPSGNIMEKGFLYTDKAKIFKETKPIEHCEDLNLFSAWQLNFASGTDYTSYNEDGSIRNKLKSSFNDSIGEDIIIYANYKNGNLLSNESRWRGLQFGRVNNFYSNGTLEMSGNYIIIDKDSIKVSVKNGVFKYYHSNGLLKAEVNYSRGEETGNSYFYDTTGNLIRRKIIKENGAVCNIFKNDTVNLKDSLGRKQGKWVRFNRYPFLSNTNYSTPNVIEYYKNDKPTGIWLYYNHTNDFVEKEVIWENPINSFCKNWNKNGQLIAEGNMTNNIKDGEWKVYDTKKGYLKFKGNYKCGNKDGIWTEYKRNGKIVQNTQYEQGKLIQ